MKEKLKTTDYPSRNVKTQTYVDGATFITKHFYDARDAYVREFISLKDGVQEIKHYTDQGVLSKLDHFVENKRHGLETKYMISKANSSVKSTKMYENGKLHGENITYSQSGEVVKHEVFALGKLVLKYLREDSDSDEITKVTIVDKESIVNLPTTEHDKLQNYI